MPAPQPAPPAQSATEYCQQNGQLSFNIPFTQIPVTISLSGTALVFNWSSTNDVSFVFPPSIGASVDLTVGAPELPNIPVQVGQGRNLSVGTFLTGSGPKGFSASLGVSRGPEVTISPQVGNLCGKFAGEQ